MAAPARADRASLSAAPRPRPRSSVLLIATQSLSAPGSPALAWAAAVAPFPTTYLLIKVSGIPAMHAVNAGLGRIVALCYRSSAS